MSRPDCRLKKISIDRVLGIERGEGFSIDELSPGVNVIQGPNGSGKSTTAQAIQESLWPGGTGLARPSISALMVNAAEEWSVDIDAGHAVFHRNGASGTAPEFGPAEFRSRYRLELKELLTGDNAEFEKIIARESQGGLDIEAAVARLKLEATSAIGRKERRAVDECAGRVAGARALHETTIADSDRLYSLLEEQKACRAARSELEMLGKAIEYSDAKSACMDSKVLVSSFPDNMKNLSGDEKIRLTELVSQIDSCNAELRSEEERLQRAKSAIAECGLSEDPAPGLIPKLRSLSNELRDAELEHTQIMRTRAERASDAARLRERLQGSLAAGQIELLNRMGVQELDSFARRSSRARHNLDAIQSQIRIVEKEPALGRKVGDSRRVNEGIVCLSRWLSAPSTESRPTHSGVSWISYGLSILLAVSLAVIHHPAWIAAALLSGILAACQWRQARGSMPATGAATKESFRDAYLATGLDAPSDWSLEAVSEKNRELSELRDAAALRDRLRERLEALKSELARADEEISLVQEERRKIEAGLGIHLEIEDEWLPALVNLIAAWQTSEDELARADALLRNLDEKRARTMEELNSLLDPYGYSDISSHSAAEESIRALAERQSKREDALRVIQEVSRRIETSLRPSLEKNTARRAEIYRGAGIEPGDDGTLASCLAQLSKYRDAVRKLTEETVLRDDRLRALEGREDLAELTSSELSDRQQSQNYHAKRYDQLTEQIAAIRQRIESAKVGSDLSNALSATDLAMADLERARERAQDAAAGAILVEWLRKTASDRLRPEVFRRAGALFANFTRGNLSLTIADDAGKVSLCAKNVSGRERRITELSNGERVQLLMAVRMAFVEENEHARLPLILDECLATADDGAADAVIDAVLDLARDGRQIFCFSAQSDETGKWLSRLENAGVPFARFDLAQIRRLSGAAGEMAFARTAKPALFDPSGLSYDEYGRALEVPALDPAAADLPRLHVWYLFDDNVSLTELLRRGIETVGQFETLVSHGGGSICDDANALALARARLHFLKAAFDGWRVGRGRAVDRAVLLDSGHVTDNFIDDVAALSERKNGDAAAILAALDDRVVSGWRRNKTAELRDYLAEHGYLPEEPALSGDEIRIRAIASAGDHFDETIVERCRGLFL